MLAPEDLLLRLAQVERASMVRYTPS